MAPSSYKKKSGRRPRVERRSASFSDGTPAKRRRVEHDVIEGVDIFSFENELELDYFTNIEEPLPRRIYCCRGFDDDYEAASQKRIKSSFELFIGKNNENIPRKGYNERVEVPQCAATSSASQSGDLIVLSDDESTLEPAAVSHVDTDAEDELVQLVTEPTDIITIDSDDDSDDDVVMVSDPNAPLPRPVRDCVCPNCGKVKRTDQNRLIPESNKDSGVDDVSIITDEEAIVIDDHVPVLNAPIPNKTKPFQPKDLPPKAMPLKSVDIREEVPVQSADVLTEGVSTPAAAEILTEEIPSPAAAEPLSVSISRSPLKVNNAFRSAYQQSPSSLPPSRPQHNSMKPSNNISLKVQKPSGPLKPSATVPQTLCVVSKESGKTFYLKVNGAKSKILKPSTTPSNLCNSSADPQSQFHYLRPGKKPCGVSSSEAKTVTQVQEPPPMSVVGPRMAEVKKIKQPERTPKSVVGPRTAQFKKIKQPNLTPKSVVGPQAPEFRKIEQPNGGPCTYSINIPPNTIRVTIPPGFSDKNNVIKAQPIDGAMGPVHVKNAIVAKPSVVIALGSSLQTGLVIVPPQSPVKLPAKTVANAQQTNYADVASDCSVLRSACLNGTIDSAVLESLMTDNAEVESPITEPVVLEDDTKSVVKDLIDFVCRQEDFPTSYPYDHNGTEQLSIDVPCRQLRCRMGCMCVSLAKKNVRRVRCKNADCIFGCVCMSQGVVVPANRQAKTMPNMKVLGISRRKQVLTVLPDCDADYNRICTQPALKSFLPVQKVAGVGRSISVSHRPNPHTRLQGSGSRASASKGPLSQNVPGVLRTGSVHSSSVSQESTPRFLFPGAHSIRQGSGFGLSTQPASKGVNHALKVSVPKTSVTSSRRPHPTSDLAPAKELRPPLDVPKPSAASQDPAHRPSVPVVQPRSFFGREKTPIPERALMCLTPGFGYVPLNEIHPTVMLESPFKPGSHKSFLSIRQATEWLNAKLVVHLNTKMPADLRWVVADWQTIEKKTTTPIVSRFTEQPKLHHF